MKINAVHLIGCGGTGSWIAPPLTHLMSYHPCFDGATLYLYDGDKIEDRNLERQNFKEEHIGLYKGEALLDQLLYNDVKVINEYVSDHFWSKLDRASRYGYTQVIILAIDNDHGRHDIINSIMKYPGDVLCILPGNEYETATCLWFAKEDDVIRPCHPFDIASNYANPEDKPRGNCMYEVVSTPQLITANFSSALLSLQVIHSYIEGNPLPTRLDYNLKEFKLTYDGRLK
jgi:hypothetical protein